MPEVRLIDANALHGVVKLMDTGIIKASREASFLLEQVLFDIENAPTVMVRDARPIVHAVWKNCGDMFLCLGCDKIHPHKSTRCPNCGAKMEGAE